MGAESWLRQLPERIPHFLVFEAVSHFRKLVLKYFLAVLNAKSKREPPRE